MRIKRLITCILFIQALFLCSLVSAAPQTTTLSNYKLSEFVSNPEGEFDSIDFKGSPYFIELTEGDDSFELITTTLDDKYKLVKNTASITALLNLTPEDVNYYELQVKANAKEIFALIQGDKADGTRFGYLLHSQDGKSWYLNESFPLNGTLKNKLDDLYINDAANHSLTVSYSSYDYSFGYDNDKVFFSSDDGLTWNTMEVPKHSFVADGPYIADNGYFLNLKSQDSNYKSVLYSTDGTSPLVKVDTSKVQEYNFHGTQTAKKFEYINGIHSVNGKLIAQVEYVTNDDADDYSSLLWSSNDNGKTWSVLAELPESNIHQVKFVNNTYHIITSDHKFNSFYYRFTEGELSQSSDHSMAKPTLKFDKTMSEIMNITAKEVIFLLANLDGVRVVKF